MSEEKATENATSVDENVHSLERTSCCVVGGGPAGMMLSMLLSRRGVPVTLLEAHKDFDRDFRGDTIHPSTLEILDQLGMADRLHEMPHGKIRAMHIVTPTTKTLFANLGSLKTKFPYVMTMPQARFLEYIAEEAKRHAGFKLVLGANVQRLVEENGVVQGVRYRGEDDAWHEVRAPLTVAADGRFSRVRHLAGIELVRNSIPFDVIWFRLPQKAGDPRDEGSFNISGGHIAVLLDRHDEWQVGYIFLKGGFQQLRSEGIESLRAGMAKLVPWLGDRVEALQDWKQVAVLSVESGRVRQWHKPGLLLIGDAAHVMSPIGGVGINYAIQDAVETANLLATPLGKGTLQPDDLAKVQARREWPVRIIQKVQGLLQKWIAEGALHETAERPFRLPFFVRIMLSLPILRNMPARMVAFGPRRVRVE